MKLPTSLTTTFQKFSSLQIPESNNTDPQSERISCPTLKSKNTPALQQYKIHLRNLLFFCIVEKVSVIREIKNLNKKKVIQDNDISVEILKDNVNFFADFICTFYNYTITTSKFPSFLKMVNVTPFLRKEVKAKRKNAKIKLDEFTTTSSKKGKLVGIIFDDKLKFQLSH